MFNNSGSKIQKIATIWFFCTVIVSLICAIVFAQDVYGDFHFLRFLLILAGGIGSGYVSSVFLSAFGDITENIQKTAENSADTNKMIQELFKNNTVPTTAAGSMKNTENKTEKKQTKPTPQHETDSEEEEKTRQTAQSSELNYATNPYGKKSVFPMPGDAPDKIVCPVCGQQQRAGRHICMKCGIPFMFEE